MKINNLIGKVGAFAAGAVLAANLSAAPSIEVTNVQQQYPWTNTVDIAYTVSGITNRAYYAVFEAWHGGERIGAVTNELDGTGKSLGTVTAFATQWQPPFNIQKSGVTLTPYIYRGGVDAGGDDYLVIDLETGNVAYEGMINQDFANKRYNTDEFKTRKMAFRKVPKGEYTAGGNIPGQTSFGRWNRPHKVKFPADYYMLIYPLTAAHYARLTGDNTAATLLAKTPARAISNTLRGSAGIVAAPTTGPLYDLQTKTNLKVDIPTRAMFDVAMRAGLQGEVPGGFDSVNIGVTNYVWCRSTPGFIGDYRHEVGTLKPNRWGIYDMLGQGTCIHRDGTVTTSNSGNADTSIMSAELAMANNFTPIANVSTYRYCTDSHSKYGWNNGQIASVANSYWCSPNGGIMTRLAVYPSAYYPNGGQQ